MVEGTELPSDLDSAIREHYQTLCQATGVESVPVATRSAGPSSHPGQYESYLYISGASDVVRYVRKVWSSTFNTRSIIARARQRLPLSYDPIGAAVLKMVNARSAGVMFTMNPADGDRSVVYVESNWGLGESIVAGDVTPDKFYVSKTSGEVIKRTISPKTVWYVFDHMAGRVVPQPVPEDKRMASSLKDEHLQELIKLGLGIEQHFGVPQDIEWGVDSDIKFPDNVLLLQARAVKNPKEKKDPADRIIDLMVRGITARR
jgi:pyruvate,water dikinase